MIVRLERHSVSMYQGEQDVPYSSIFGIFEKHENFQNKIWGWVQTECYPKAIQQKNFPNT